MSSLSLSNVKRFLLGLYVAITYLYLWWYIILRDLHNTNDYNSRQFRGLAFHASLGLLVTTATVVAMIFAPWSWWWTLGFHMFSMCILFCGMIFVAVGPSLDSDSITLTFRIKFPFSSPHEFFFRSESGRSNE